MKIRNKSPFEYVKSDWAEIFQWIAWIFNVIQWTIINVHTKSVRLLFRFIAKTWNSSLHAKIDAHIDVISVVAKLCSHIFDFCSLIVDIEAQIADIQNKKKELAASQASEKGVGLLESGYYDSELYDDGGDKKKRYEGYMTSIAANDDADEDDDEGLPVTKRTTYTAPKSILKDVIKQVKIIDFSCCFIAFFKTSNKLLFEKKICYRL